MVKSFRCLTVLDHEQSGNWTDSHAGQRSASRTSSIDFSEALIGAKASPANDRLHNNTAVTAEAGNYASRSL